MNSRTATKFTPLGFLLGVVAAIVLVLLTFNPSEYSYFHWVKEDLAQSNLGPLHLLAGVLLAIGWAIYLRATFRALGPIGLALATALVAALVWLLVDLGWLAADSNVAPVHTLDTVEAIVTHPQVQVHGLLLTLKLLQWELADQIPAYLDRVRSWGYRHVKARQLSFNRQEICVAAMRRRGMRRGR